MTLSPLDFPPKIDLYIWNGNTPLAHGEHQTFWNVKDPTASLRATFLCTLRSDNRKRSTSDQCSTRSSNVLKRLMSNHSVLHGRRMFWNFWRSSKHNKTKDQVTFLITNPNLRLVTTLLDCHPHVGVITFYRNTLTKCWTFWNVRGLKVFLHSHMWGYFLKRRTFRNVWRLACANCVLDYFDLEPNNKLFLETGYGYGNWWENASACVSRKQ